MAKPTAAEIANELQGTCMSLLQVLERHDAEELEDDKDFCYALDALVFCCIRCDWWYEQSEMAEDTDDWICQECFDEGA